MPVLIMLQSPCEGPEKRPGRGRRRPPDLATFPKSRRRVSSNLCYRGGGTEADHCYYIPTLVSTLVKYCHDGWARVSVNMPPFPGPWRVASVYRGLAPAEDWLSGAELGPAPLGLGNPGSRDTDTVGSGSLVPLEFR